MRPPGRWLIALGPALFVGLLGPARAGAGHELPFYPGYYPQEIRLDTLAPAAAAPMLQRGELHAYVGADPFPGRKDPADIRSVDSFASFLVITLNTALPAFGSRESRCEATVKIGSALASGQGLYVIHPYPVTPFDPDYLDHWDLVQARKRAYEGAARSGATASLRLRAKGSLAAKLLGRRGTTDGNEWDAEVEEVDLDRLTAPRRIAINGWLGPPWIKAGWFHAYLLHAPAIADDASRQAVEALYHRLVTGSYVDLGAFSSEEARRRGVPWLDLARDPKLREALAPIVDAYAKEAYIPGTLRRFVTADEAETRWTALRQFFQRRGHFLVTNGPYRLVKWTDTSVTLEVVRDFTNPMGVGSFDRFAIPRRAYVARVVPRADRLEIYPEIERVEKFLRDYRVVREPLGAPGTDEDKLDIPACRYVVVGGDGRVAAAGLSREAHGNRLIVDLAGRLRPGSYTVLLALVLGDNEVNPEIATANYRVEAGP